jgi:hypothetical protein
MLFLRFVVTLFYAKLANGEIGWQHLEKIFNKKKKPNEQPTSQ